MNKLLISGLLAMSMAGSWAATTVNTTNKFTYGANFGWMDWRGDTNNGAVIGEYVCSGYLYAANIGWISLGGGSPANGIQYSNNAANNFGVNHDGLGNLRGFAYSANIGWINFESNGAARVDLKTGKLSGFAYSANCGWISLSNAFAQVQTDSIQMGADFDTDGMADAWEIIHFQDLSATPGADADGDGMSNLQEYLADTDPDDADDKLVITAFSTSPGGTLPNVTWNSVLTRQYRIEKALDLTAPVWLDSGLGLISPDGATTARSFADTNAPSRFYRVNAMKPLAP